MCKIEQISNWNRRPLRKSQMHYAALDAHSLIKIVEKIGENMNLDDSTCNASVLLDGEK